MSEDELKQWLRENLMVEVRTQMEYDFGTKVTIGLRLVGDSKSFADDYVIIKEAA